MELSKANGGDNSAAFELDDQNPNFKDEIAKSKAMIDGADKAPETPAGAGKTKNKGGRPSNADKEAKAAAEQAAKLAELEQQVPKESLKSLVALPFGLLAFQTGFNGFQLTNEEADAIVPSMHAVMAKYAPMLKPDDVALMTFAGSLFSIGLMKYMAFLQFKKAGGNSSEIQSQQDSTDAPQPSESADPIPVLRV